MIGFKKIEDNSKMLHFVEFLILYIMVFSIIVCSAILCYSQIHTRTVIIACTVDTVAMAITVAVLCSIMMNGKVNSGIRKFVVMSLLLWALFLSNFSGYLFMDVKGYGWVLLLSKYLYYALMGITMYAYWVFLADDYGFEIDRRIPAACFALFMVLLLSNYWTGFVFTLDPATSTYSKSSTSFLAEVPGVILMVASMLIMRNHVVRGERLFMYFLLILPLSGMALQVFNVDLEIMGLFLLLSMIFVFGKILFARGKKLNEQTMVMEATRIRPHFIFNSIGAIMNIPGNPDETKEALLAFSSYLRSSMDFMSKSGLTTFENEMENVEAYVHLEKIRLKDRLVIEYDLRSGGFIIPAFSIEVLVENAIQHGIVPRRETGHVKIESWSDDSSHYVRVTDDGVGYDTSKVPVDADRSHIGINSLKERIVKMSKGTFTTHSVIGVGTVATISVPKEVVIEGGIE